MLVEKKRIAKEISRGYDILLKYKSKSVLQLLKYIGPFLRVIRLKLPEKLSQACISVTSKFLYS